MFFVLALILYFSITLIILNIDLQAFLICHSYVVFWVVFIDYLLHEFLYISFDLRHFLS